MRQNRAVSGERRRWRAQHKPAIRRMDPILDFASWIVPTASFVMLFAGLGISKRQGQVPADVSAAFVIGCAVVIAVALVVVTIRLRMRPGVPPFTRDVGIAVAIVSIVSPFALWLRTGAFKELVLVAFVANAVCLVFVAMSVRAWWALKSKPDAGEATEPETE